MDYTARLARLQAQMAATGTDLVAVGPGSNMAWLSGLSPHGDERPVMQIVSQRSAAFLMPSLNADSQRALTDLPFFTWADEDGPQAALQALLASFGLGGPLSVAIDETMRADFALLVLDAVDLARRQFLPETLGVLRARKDADEYARLKENALINDRAMIAAFDALHEGVSEAEVCAVIVDSYRAAGAEAEFLSVCFGENGAYPHYTSGAARLRAGQPVLIDIGSRKDGYPSDMTRVGWFGGAPSAEFLAVHAIVEAAVVAALAAARPGVAASVVDKAAREVIAGAGYGARFLHRTGHGLGIDLHEGPYITATSATVLQSAMVHSIEPGIYLPGKFGLRLEDVVFLREDGPEVLSELSCAPILRG